MSPRRPRAGWPLHVLRSTPLTIASVIDAADDVVVTAAHLSADHPGVQFIGVVAADDEAHLALILGGFRPHVAEVIFTAAGPGELTGADAAWLALERHGMGQDFVFTVPALADAIVYAVECLTSLRDDHWEGTAVLVLGPHDVIDAARTLSRQGRDEGTTG